MTGKTVGESALVVAYQMLPQDANPMGNVHGGVIMKLIDSTAGAVAIRHARRNAVTASIDRLDFHHPVYIGNLVHCKAAINLVSRTSMEVGVRVEAEDLLTGQVRHTGSAYLTFVVLDETGKPMPVPPIILQTEDEHRRNREATERHRRRMEVRAEKKAAAQGGAG